MDLNTYRHDLLRLKSSMKLLQYNDRNCTCASITVQIDNNALRACRDLTSGAAFAFA